MTYDKKITKCPGQVKKDDHQVESFCPKPWDQRENKKKTEEYKMQISGLPVIGSGCVYARDGYISGHNMNPWQEARYQ